MAIDIEQLRGKGRGHLYMDVYGQASDEEKEQLKDFIKESWPCLECTEREDDLMKDSCVICFKCHVHCECSK